MKDSRIKHNLDATTYHAANGVNTSSFQYIDPERDGCPEIWRAESAGEGEPRKETAAMSMGTALHSYVLEPEEFKKEFVIVDKDLKAELYSQAIDSGSKAKAFSRSLSTFKTWEAQQKEEGRRVLTEADMKIVKGLSDAALCLPKMKKIMECPKTETEISIFAELEDHQGNKVECKGRIDAFTPCIGITDLKTTVNTSPNNIGKFIANYRGYVQAAFYLDLAIEVGLADDSTTFSWCFIQKQRPHMATYYTAADDLIKLGRLEYKGWLGWIHNGRETGNWAGHSQDVELPGWLLAQLEF
tara:strand:- start:3564 stop:4460 length:897 start_codon:yes stop_codon:yes gene_type:complete